MYDEIKQARQIHDLIIEENEILEQFKNTKITNLAHLPEIKKEVEKLAAELYPRDRKLCFVLIATYLYSPISFVGGHSLVVGLRNPLAASIGCSATEASELFSEAKHKYNLLTKFREQTETVFEQITKHSSFAATYQ